MKNIILAILFATAYSLYAQSGFQQLTVASTSSAAPGYYLIAPNARDSIALMDHTGTSVFAVNTGTVTNLQPYNNTYLTYYSSIWQASSGCFVRRDKNLNIVDSLFMKGGYVVDFHEGKVWTDTSYIILGTERRTVDMSQLHPGGKPSAIILGAVIQEISFSGQLIFEWKSLDHIPVTDATEDVDLTSALIDYIHVNSIHPTSDGHILISCRHLDALVKINRGTGDVIWRLGGSSSKNSTFTIEDDTYHNFTGFSHQHSAFETPRGTIMLYDNGNLKPLPRSSRAVEYEIDLSTYTARKVWEYAPKTPLYATAMGSVQELVNGNVLVNYGALDGGPTTGSLVAEEVTRSGQVAASIRNTAQSEVTSYRVMKSNFYMSGCYNEISSPGTTLFSCDDSTTNVSLEVTNARRPTGVVVEQHNYRPHNVTFASESFCGVLPLRWVVRIQDSTALQGAIWFNAIDMPSIKNPDKIKLLYRPVEGQGSFAVIDGAYVGTQQRFRVGKMVSGEFMVAYRDCLEPSPVTPAQNATEVDQAPLLTWQAAAINDGYDVEVSQTPTFTTRMQLNTRRTDTTLSNLQLASTYYWRVRRIYNGYSKGPWSTVYRFTTQLGVPVPLSPVVAKDTVAVTTSPTFRWKTSVGAQRYQITVSDVDLEQPIVNDFTTADSFSVKQPLLSNTAYTWVVRGINGAVVGRSSPKQFFVTVPASPVLIAPANDTLIPFSKTQYVTWAAVPGARRYAVTLMKRTPRIVLKRDTVPGLWVVLSDVPEKTELCWTVRAIGRYGPGPVSQEFNFNTYSTTPLKAPVTISPRNADNIDATRPIVLSWSTVPDASSYHVQVTQTHDFRDVYTDTVVQVPTFEIRRMETGTTYSWRVKAQNQYVVSPWSDTARFITAPSSANALVPLWPRLSAADVPTTGIVRYSTADQFVRYDVEFSRRVDFDDVDLTFSSTTASVDYSQLRERTRYYWRVQGVRTDGSSAVGPYSTFVTAYETVNVDDDLASPLVSIIPQPRGLMIQSTSAHALHYRAMNLLGQTLTGGVVHSNAAVEISQIDPGVVFVVVTPEHGPEGALTQTVIIR
jgi:hypothetical protein